MLVEVSWSQRVSAAACVRWIRFNPDTFRVGGCVERFPKKERWQFALIRLRCALEDTDFSSMVTIEYVCYDKPEGEDAEGKYVRTLRFNDIVAFEAAATGAPA